ncbi:hypothetical protein [Photobacterium sanguinicancri]|uniref:FlgD Ig-like domain-containing protein n=1 Tax=Photobacterium sanguinicancri TaxID=875932 RepID=A0ABX4G4R6_9GAMM|nr:hypothetical protein [Photobacterium sanguinicancri]OZS45575.1 hypothetical protein ASV53_02495 [Photobacterium sanguinicancri]
MIQRRVKAIFFLMLFCFTSSCLAKSNTENIESNLVAIKPFATNTFNPSDTNVFHFSIDIHQKVLLEVSIVSTDRDVVKTIYPLKLTQKGTLTLAWDGKDELGVVVPDEAWFPVIRYVYEGDEYTVTPMDNSGGEILQSIPIVFQSREQLNITLDQPARLLVRAGLKSGAMLKTISDWRPLVSGTHLIHWDGLDTSGVYPFTESEDFAVMATAFALPEHAIMTWGNASIDYVQWHKLRGYSEHVADRRANIKQSRDGKTLSKVFFKPMYLPRDPRVTVYFDTRRQASANNELAFVQVDIPKEDRGIVEKSLFEVGFFINGQFVSEEEQGYVPFVWQFNPNEYPKGDHYLTVNISGFDGQVGVATVKFTSTGKGKSMD